MTLVNPAFCSAADLERYFSSQGVLAFSDHDEDGSKDTGVVDDCINQATSEISDYGTQWYSSTALASNTTINRWATTLAVYFLCGRRGNPIPDSLQMEFERITKLLEKLASGEYKLAGVSLRADMRPSMSNVEIDRRYRHSTVRVTPNNSTDAPTALSQDQADFPIVY